MNKYQKTAFVYLRANGYLAVLYAFRELVAVMIYVPGTYLRILPAFYLNVGYNIFWGLLTVMSGLLIIAVSRPLAMIVGASLEEDR